MMRAASFDIAGTAELWSRSLRLSIPSPRPPPVSLPPWSKSRPFGMRSPHASRRLSRGSGRAIRHFLRL